MPLAVERLRDLTEEQWGLFTRRQAVDAGVGWSSLADLVRRGLIERVAHGVYRMRGAPEPDHLGLRAAWLQLDPARPAWERVSDPDDPLVSHTSAAALYGVGDLRADTREFTVAAGPFASTESLRRFERTLAAISQSECHITLRLIGGSHIGYARSAGRWWIPIQAAIEELGITESPVRTAS